MKKNNSREVQSGVLSNNLRGDQSGTNLVTDRVFRDFTLRCEFMVPEGSNSGIYLHAPEHGRNIWCGMKINIFHEPDAKPGRPLAYGDRFKK